MNLTLRNARIEREMTQLEFSRFCGVSERTIQYAEAGKPVRRETARKIAVALGVEMAELFGPTYRAFKTR